MPLDDAERSVLEETERALAEHDPSLARRLRRGWHGSARRRGMIVTAVALLLIVGLLWLDLVGQAFLIAMLASAVVVVCGWWPSGEIAARMRRGEGPGGRR